MSKNSYIDKRNRIERLIGLLKSQEYWTTKELSLKLEVSHRTLTRDLNVIQEMGIPIETSKGRGGGLKINSRYGLSRLDLNHKEVIDLLLALATIEKLKTPIFLQDMRSIKDKIAKCFPADQRASIESLRNRIYIGNAASPRVLSSYSPKLRCDIQVLYKAFFDLSLLQIAYQSEKGEILERKIEPHYLILCWPVWYISAWDHLRADIRFFRIDRIRKSQILKDDFRLHHRNAFKEQLAHFSEPI